MPVRKAPLRFTVPSEVNPLERAVRLCHMPTLPLNTPSVKRQDQDRIAILTAVLPRPILLAMKRRLPSCFFVVGLVLLTPHVRAETETIDLKALAKKARPAVMLLVVSDANGKEVATGTGFLVSSDGKLITNHHVIEGAASAVAKAENGGLFPIEGVLADDPKNDLVLLKLKGKDLPFLTLANSDKTEVGTRIAVIGSPLGLEGTLSEGIVSAVREFSGDMRLLQVSAAISPGSSGSPVLNPKGDVVGVAFALLSGGQSLNFAVPVETARTLLVEAQKSEKARPFAVRNAVSKDALYRDPDYLAAIAAEAASDYRGMLNHARSLVEKYPAHYYAQCSLGNAYGNLGHLNEAITAFLEALRIKPDSAFAWHNLGTAYCKLGRATEAITAYKQAIKLKLDWAVAWSSLGIIYIECGRTKEGISAHEEAVRLKPSDPDMWYALGYAYDQANRTTDSITVFLRAIKLKPDFAQAWYNLGISYQKTRKDSDAAAALDQARRLNPSLFK
jgi:S1-C subfamily serine protease/cytochrome c-type biogenesis protein CcmH/NrfG